MSPTTTVLRGKDPRSPLDPVVLPGAAITPAGSAPIARYDIPRRAELIKKRRERVAVPATRAGSDPDESLRIFLRNLLRARARRMISWAGKAAGGEDAEVLHRLRVSARRLQAFLKVFQDSFPGGKFRAHTRTLRKLLKASGRVREYDILISMLEQYKESRPVSERLIFELLIARKSRERREARRALEHTLAAINRKKFRSNFLEFVSSPR